MVGPIGKPVSAVVVGANHRTSPLSVRDRLFVEDADVPAVIARLRDAGLGQAVVISTCDRVEVLTVHDDADAAATVVRRVLAGHAGMDEDALAGQTYVHTDDDAVRHVFRVAASLDSQVVGEPQVLGQVKAAHRLARTAGSVDGELEALLQAAFVAAKRVRTDTAIGERPVSIAAAAAQLARDVHGDLSEVSALLLGDGDIGELVAASLSAAGLGTLIAVHPNEARSEAAAQRLDCHVAPFDLLGRHLAEADVVVTALGRRERTLDADMVRSALKARRRRPVFIADLAVPGDVDPAVDRLDEAFLYDLGDLERVAMQGLSLRENEAVEAQRIIDEELSAFLRGRASRAAVPALTRLRRHFDDAREQALADARGDAEKATRLLVNRLLHGPTAMLRDAAARDGTGDQELQRLEATIGRLFRLDGAVGDAESGEDDPE